MCYQNKEKGIFPDISKDFITLKPRNNELWNSELLIRYSEQKGSDGLVHYIEVWVYFKVNLSLELSESPGEPTDDDR